MPFFSFIFFRLISEEYDDNQIPCEFCKKTFTFENIEVHQVCLRAIF